MSSDQRSPRTSREMLTGQPERWFFGVPGTRAEYHGHLHCASELWMTNGETDWTPCLSLGQDRQIAQIASRELTYNEGMQKDSKLWRQLRKLRSSIPEILGHTHDHRGILRRGMLRR